MKHIFNIYPWLFLLFYFTVFPAKSSPQQKKIKSLEKTIQLAKRTGDHHTLASAYYDIGQVYNEEQHYLEAGKYYKKAGKYAEITKKPGVIMDAYLKAGIAYGNAGEFKESVEPVEIALTWSTILNDNKTELHCYSLLAEYYSQLSNTVKANEYLAHYNKNVHNIENAALAAQKINELKTKIDKVIKEKNRTESELQSQSTKLAEVQEDLEEKAEMVRKNQMKIQLLNKDNELVQARLDHQKLVKNFIIAFLVLTTGFVTVLGFAYRKKIEKNKQIALQNENITSSINYAQRIQEAMLPKRDNTIPLLTNSFILFKPRNIVSGDFYWFTEVKNSETNEKDALFAVVDCTGHSIPGAFMSMVGINCLNSIVGRGISETNEILSALHSEIRTALRQPETGNNDGMDIGICIYRKSKKILEFSGGKHPLVYIQNGEITLLKGDSHPMGGSSSEPEIAFTKHEIPIETSTMIYMFSDGYCDQFGGEGDKKFLSANLRKLLHKIHEHPLEEQKEILDTTIEEWRGAYEQTDDILVMGIRIDPLT